MHSFLNNIVDAYVDDPQLSAYTFVFPNVRSKRYFAERLNKMLKEHGRPSINTDEACLTLTRLAEHGAQMHRADSEVMLFLLYQAYVEASNSFGSDAPKLQEFDSFRMWGQRILKDFNDVDHYMANPDEIFRNAAEYKKVQARYLTEEQMRIIKTYWGDDPYWSGVAAGAAADQLPLWSHVSGDGDTEKKFTQLWAILGKIYHRFQELLGRQCYPGKAAKAFAEALRGGDDIPVFHSSLFVFIGFNRLTTAETIIFEQLDKRAKAHFYWDYDPQLMGHLGANPANRFISKYIERFTACNPNVASPQRAEKHQVDVIGVPSGVGQAKVMAQVLQKEESAVILPQEDMLLPVVSSVPDRFKQVNVTAGYPMRYSALSQFFAMVVTLQNRSSEERNGDVMLFHDDVRALITNPLMQAAFGNECRWVEEYMRHENLFNLPASRTSNPGFGPLATIFAPIPATATVEQMAQYVTDIIDLAKSKELVKGIDAKCCEVIIEEMRQIAKLAKQCNVQINKRTFFNLIERTLFKRSIPLEGESFEAMQIMGVLETRALGFPSVVMLSMTDDVFPGHDYSASFITESLRHAYGLPTRDHSEVDAAYHFYHILSYAEHLTLIYDGRIGGLASGEMSRYIHQLRRLNFPGVNVKMHLATFDSEPAADTPPLIVPDAKLEKNARIMPKLDNYRNPALLRKYALSASALKTYVHCPMHFYLQNVERISPPDADNEGISNADFGNVVHEVADRIYSQLAAMNRGMITIDMLNDLLAGGHNDMLNRELTRAINLKINRFDEIDATGAPNESLFTTPIEGEPVLLWESFITTLHQLFNIDKQYAPFEVLGTELSDTFSWPVAPGLSINFTMKIDRIDRITEADGTKTIRLIDYKTGDESMSCDTIATLFDPVNQPEGMFQLFLYCAAYAYRYNVDPLHLRPHIFPLKNPKISDIPFLKCDGKEVKAYGDFEADFKVLMEQMFMGIFDPSQPIERATDDTVCEFCKAFYRFCHKDFTPPKKKY